jgi:DNA-binding phage protein
MDEGAWRMPSRTEPADMPVHPVMRELFGAMREQGRDFEGLAKQAGLAKSTIQKWPTAGNPSLLSFIAVAEALGMEVVLREIEREVNG